MIKTQSQHYLDNVKHNPCASYWVKEAMEKLAKRDCLDALADAEELVHFMKMVCNENGIKV